MTVTTRGALADVAVLSNGTGDKKLAQCVVAATSDLNVPHMPPAPVKVIYPLSFQPQRMKGKGLGMAIDDEKELGNTKAAPEKAAAPTKAAATKTKSK